MGYYKTLICVMAQRIKTRESCMGYIRTWILVTGKPCKTL